MQKPITDKKHHFGWCTILLPLLAGCGGGVEKFPTSKTTGVVTCEGSPVGHVQVIFAPIAEGKGVLAGKSGYGIADAEGKFVLTSYDKEDGAVLGKHNVIVSTPRPDDLPDFSCECETDSRKNLVVVEVTANGENHFAIELPKKPKPRRGQKEVIDEDLQDILDKD